jgi:F-type H+-transporting ATPase subunit delta
MAKSTKQTRREAHQLFRLCFVNGRLDESRVREVIRTVLHSRRRGYLVLAKDFQRLVRLESDRHSARVESPIRLPADLTTDVRARIEKLYGSRTDISFSENPGLIGGLRIRVGSDVYDHSIQAGLAALAKCFGNTSTRQRNTGR